MIHKITITIEAADLDEEARSEAAVEILRSVNAVLAPWLSSRDSLQGEVKWTK